MVDEGNRCPFLLENDDSKIGTCMCNYYSLGQAELARALLHIVATKNLARALRIVKTIIWHGPPKHWLCSVFVPSSAHLAWLCLIDFQDLVEAHMGGPGMLPPWLVKRLEFDVLIAQALLDGAATQAQVLTAEVASELRAYHAGLLSATSSVADLPAELQVPLSFKLPALSLLQVTTQVSPYVNFLPAHTTDREEQLEYFSSGGAGLSKAAVQQLYDLCKSQPLLGHCISFALAPRGCAAAVKTARRIQQMCLGLTADALLQNLKGDAWRYLKFLEVSDAIGIPPPMIELFSILLIVVISNIRPTPALQSRLQALVSMSTSSVNTSGSGSGNRGDSGYDRFAAEDSSVQATANTTSTGSPLGLGVSHAAASQTLAEIFAQAMPAEGSAGVKPWEHLRQLAGVGGSAAEVYAAAGAGGTAPTRSSAMHFSRFLNRIRGGEKFSGGEDSTQSGARALDALDARMDDVGLRSGAGGNSGWKMGGTSTELAARLGKHGVVDAVESWEIEGPVEAARIAFLYRTKIYEAFLTHDSCGTHTALRLFSVLEDEFLRLKSVQSPLPPAFELLQPAEAASYLFEMPPITFWDAYFEFTRVANAHCLEYVVQTAVNFIRAHDFGASAWLLAPFPQLKPLVILLCWPEFHGDVESRQSLLDTLWKSYTEETRCDTTKTGDLLVDHWVEVLNYRLSVSWWISKLIVSQDDQAGTRSGGAGAALNYRSGGLDGANERPRSKDDKSDNKRALREEAQQSSLPQIAAEVLNRVTTHSILYVMRPNLPMVQSGKLLSALQSLPPLRQAAAALEHSYDLDLTRCYYTVRCAMFLVERCVHTQGAKPSYEYLTPGRQVIQDGVNELDRLISSIERTPLKVSVFLLISSLCFTRHSHLDNPVKMPDNRASTAVPFGTPSDFLVPPSVLLSLLSLLRHHLRPLAAHAGMAPMENADEDAIEGADEQLLKIITRLYQFTEETIWRIFISLKDFFTYSQLGRLEGSIQLKPGQRMEHASVEWTDAVGAVITGEIKLAEFFDRMPMQENTGTAGTANEPPHAITAADGLKTYAATHSPGGSIMSKGADTPEAHPFLQLCTPMEVPLSLQPSTFVPRMLSGPVTLLHRSLKMNDYLLSRRLLQYFPALRGGACESTVQIAERFKDLRRRLVSGGIGVDAEEMLSDELLDAQLGEGFETGLLQLVSAIRIAEAPSAVIDIVHEAHEEVVLLSSLSRPLLSFYVLVDLAVSAAPFAQMSTHLLKKAALYLKSEDMPNVANPSLLPDSDSVLNFFLKFMSRLSVLVEVRPEFKGRASLASIILGIETLPSEPALLKSHLNRLHSQRHAIMSLVESVDLVKKGQTSASQRTLVDFLSSAIKSLTSDEEDSSKAVTNPDDRDADTHDAATDAEQMAEGLGASRYLLRFLEYLTKVADLMHSASIEAQARKPTKKVQELKKQKKEGLIDVVVDTGFVHDEVGEVHDEGVEVTKLFDVLAETPKGIVARLLFELGGHKQALALSEVMDVDLVEVIVNSSWVLPVWKQQQGRKTRQSLRDPSAKHYPASMEVVLYLAQHENSLPQVRCPDAPLLAMMACLERRSHRWPSWRMLNFAKEQSEHRFPALHRWVEERCHALRAIQWSSKLGDASADTTDRSSHVLEDLEESADDKRPDEELSNSATLQDSLSAPEVENAEASVFGYTDTELHQLSVEDQLALEAIGGDHEAGMSAAYTRLVNALMKHHRYEEALQVCDEYLPFSSSLTDTVLQLYLNSPWEKCRTMWAKHSELLDHECMYRVKQDTLVAQLTLQRYKSWDVDTTVHTVILCLQRLDNMPGSDEQVRSLKEKLKNLLDRMLTFKKMLQVSGGRWTVWQEIEDMEHDKVSDAVAHLLALQQHDLARTLTQMHSVEPLHSLELSRLHYLFTIKNDKTSAVNRLLSFPPAQAVTFALQLLDMFDLIHHRVLLCRMLLTRLNSWLSEAEGQRLRVLHASLQLLGTVSDTMQPHFLQLLRKPVLIVESLLMNARVDLLKPFLSDFPEYRHDKLILRYARKALALSPTPSGSAPDETSLGSLEAADGEDAPVVSCERRGLGGAWCLTGFPSEDSRIRDEHVFRAAPSIGLAEEILEICSDLPENASSCFGICNELSLRLHALTPKYSVASNGYSEEQPELELDGSDGVFIELSEGSGAAPLSSVQLVTFLVRRLLVYLQDKFRGAGAEIQMKLDRSLNNLDFIPLIWQISGRKVGLSQLCNPEQAAALRDELIQADHLDLALELCERCSGDGKGEDVSQGAPIYSERADSAWHISVDPVREAKAVAFQKLHRYSAARQEFRKSELAMPHATKATLSQFEHTMRYPQLYDLPALDHMQSLYTQNSLTRKLYRSTALLAPLPTMLFPGNRSTDPNSEAKRLSGQENAKMPVPPVPVIPIGHPVDGPSILASRGLNIDGSSLTKETASGSAGELPKGGSVGGQGDMQLRAMEERLRTSMKQRRVRRQATTRGFSFSEKHESDNQENVPPVVKPMADETADMSAEGEQRTLFANAVSYLYPPIHSTELPSWAVLQDSMKISKGSQARTAKEVPVGDAPPEEVHQARPAPHPPEDKDRVPEEIAVANETEMDGEKIRDEEVEKLDLVTEVNYDKLMMDATKICFGCGASQNLRSQSNLWPDDNETHNLMPASPMSLPLAVPVVLAATGENHLRNLAFNELLHYQENYGTAESLLSMLVREHHLSQACYYIFNEKVSKRLFVDVVAHHCLAHNQIHDLQRVILDFDPSLRRVQEYLNVLKEFLRERRALDLLYSYQVFTKDFVNAGLLAIQLFIASNTWDARVGHLQNAYAHLSVAHRQLFPRRHGASSRHLEPKDVAGVAMDTSAEGGTAHGTVDGTSHGSAAEILVDSVGEEITEGEIRRNLEVVKLQMAICESMPTEMPHNVDLFGPSMSQCEVAERLLVHGQFDLASRTIDFLDLPVVELCVRASNQIATTEARNPLGSITPVVRFLESIPKLPPVEWDSLVSNVVNIWIIEKAELNADPSAASQLIRFVLDERCRMDVHVLTGNLNSAFQIAQRLGNLQDVLHIRSCAQKAGEQELLKNINTFLAYTSPGRDYLKANLSF